MTQVTTDTTTSSHTHPAQVFNGLGDPPAASPLHVLSLDQRTYDRSLDCVHCGLCLPACPTYTENGLEADSPRGRIYLMKGLADGKIEPTDAVVKHLDLCLDCRACETACPSGVQYHELIEETRQKLASSRPTSWVDKLINTMFFHVFPYPTRLRLAMLPAVILQKLGLWKLATQNALIAKLLPQQMQKMQQMLPAAGNALWPARFKPFYPANPKHWVDGKPKATVALFAGCVGSVLFHDVNLQMIQLLCHVGCDVVVPDAQVCCGAIHHHGGKWDKAKAFAIANLDAFEKATHAGTVPEYVVNGIAGCGAMLKDYAHLLRDDTQHAQQAIAFQNRVRDFSELWVTLDAPMPTHEVNRTATYHDACHLLHAQKVAAPPRQLLASIKGLTVVALPESDMCCGAAGTYNLSQPEMAMQLAQRKLGHIAETGASVCVTGNVGCAMQLQSEADRAGQSLAVVHPATLLHEAYFG